jgi:chromosome segregation protein
VKLTRLRIAGFKTFVEPTEFLIESGLTGVVGPNGCGKSNLVEALRWVMGESSHKNMRASGMEDVIFGGSNIRPARDFAEVMLTIDNSARTAPAAFNDADSLEVSRKIERDEGSTYRINGREVRARDVQILFADAATGARSAAMVRQGQISEIISAKPQARRRILEDAAGIAGLHARRHEAELRLKAAEDNLVRVEDVLREIDGQASALERQSRQAARYRSVAGEIRRLEAALLLIGYLETREEASAAAAKAQADVAAVADAASVQTEAATRQAVAAHAIPALREAEAAAAAGLQRLVVARAELDGEERRAKERLGDLVRQAADLDRDIVRQAALREDAAASLERLSFEDVDLAAKGAALLASREAAESRLATTDAAAAQAESRLAAIQSELAEIAARRSALERTAREESERVQRFATERERIARERAALEAAGATDLDAVRRAASEAQAAVREADEGAAQARLAVASSRDVETAARIPLAEAERLAQRLETEARTLAKLVIAPPGRFAGILDAIAVGRGFETALGAALGEDLDASSDPAAPAHWALTEPADPDPPLPPGVTPLADAVDGPPALRRRLAQIGVVERADGPRLRALLRPGQRLVSREGDLWRWDGYTAAAEAPSAAARRLAERNRLADIERDAAAARKRADQERERASAAAAAVKAAIAAETRTLDLARTARRVLDETRDRLAKAEKRESETAARRSALDEAASRVAASEGEAVQRRDAALATAAGIAPAPDEEAGLREARAEVAQRRAEAAEARAALQGLLRDAEIASRRRQAIAGEAASWTERATRAAAAAGELDERLTRVNAERRSLEEAPDDFLLRRRALLNAIEEAETRRRRAADDLSQAETILSEADRAARAALDGLAAAREAAARSAAQAEAQAARLAAILRTIAETLDTTPAGLLALAGFQEGADLPAIADIEDRLGALKGDRERLGAVNLRAEDELQTIVEKRGVLIADRDDLLEAIKRLRQAVWSLNREARERLLAAFDVVNGHFQRLFSTLFGGGTAELTLVDAEDPLDAGLDILARPPGKKPQTMTLLSGGEQALTATALIFAVFLTNPSPICVLDEVDAPLDDANVERYCDLLDDMARRTATRFIVITHNPITMARMNRLFGVTMAERGVSQLVSVDLDTAERIREAV